MDKTALFNLSYGLFAIGAKGEKLNACIANTAIQVTSEPVKLSVTLNNDNFTTGLIIKSGAFSVSVLSNSVSMETIGRFGFKSGANFDKFTDFDYNVFSGGVPYLKNEVNAAFLCKLTNTLSVGSHTILVGEMTECLKLSAESSLTYKDYHSLKNGVTPKNAPSYNPAAVKKGYRCSVCGYIYEGDDIPDDYICPVCKATRDKFLRIDK